METISIIIPTYNAEKYLERCLISVINQTYKNIEIIIVNDGSTDNTLHIIREFENKDSRIKVIDKKNEGVSVARNIGINFSKGEYITFVDADDWLEENAIENLYTQIKEKNVDIVRGNYYRNYTEKDSIIEKDDLSKFKNIKIIENSQEMKQLIENFYLEKIPSYVWLLLIKRDKIYGNIYFRDNISIMEDAIFYIELLYNCKSIFMTDEKIYHYFCNNESAVMSNTNLEKKLYDRLEVNGQLKSIIFKNEKNKNNFDKLNASCVRVCLTYLFKISIFDEKNLKQIYKDLQNNEEFRKDIEEIDWLELSIQDKIQVKLFKNDMYYFLLIYFKFRNIMKKLKYKILKRKNV